jgi:hypothetical protein
VELAGDGGGDEGLAVFLEAVELSEKSILHLSDSSEGGL